MDNDIYSDFSAFYDLYVGQWIEDLPFYLEYAQHARTPVLEVGAGSGRLTIPLARQNIKIIAVDVSPSMLNAMRSHLANEPPQVQSNIQMIQTDGSSLSLPERYDLIFLPFYTFNYLLTPESQSAILNNLKKHLSPRGKILIDVFLPLRNLDRCPTEPMLKCDALDPKNGNRIRGWNLYSYDTTHQLETRKHLFEITSPKGHVSRKNFTTTRKYFSPNELANLFQTHNLIVEDIFTGYQKAPPKNDSEQLMYVLKASL